MMKFSMAAIAVLGFAAPLQAHQIWIEQADGQNAIIRFGEFGENLREASPGLLDKFAKPVGTLVSASGDKKAEGTKTSSGFTLPFSAGNGDSVVAEDAAYPLYKWKQQDKEITNWFHPAARLITNFAEQKPRLTLDLVPAGERGRFKLFLNGKPKAKIKVVLMTQSGWSKEGQTDNDGVVTLDMPWKGPYVAEVSVNERSAGERTTAGSAEKYDAVSYVTTLTYVSSEGLEPVPAGPPATPNK